jgi:hypothetical protein
VEASVVSSWIRVRGEGAVYPSQAWDGKISIVANRLKFY